MKRLGKPMPWLFIVKHSGYPFDVLVAIGATNAQIIAKLRRYDIELTSDERDSLAIPTKTAYCLMLTGGQCVMRFAGWNSTIEDCGMLSHKVFHAVELLFRRIGIKLCSGSDEAYAYAIAGLTKAIMRQLNKFP